MNLFWGVDPVVKYVDNEENQKTKIEAEKMQWYLKTNPLFLSPSNEPFLGCGPCGHMCR